MDAKQLSELVIRPTLKKLGLYSLSAERLILGTIYQESLGRFLKQRPNGPALGLIQMEPETYHDIWAHFLAYRRDLSNRVTSLASVDSLDDDMRPHVNQLISNLEFAVAMCRVHYLRARPKLPAPDDIEGLGRYWKEHYNTHLGAGTPAEFVEKFPKSILNEDQQ